MAHVQKRNGRWQARFRDNTGREVSRRFERKVDATRWANAQEADLARGIYVDPAAGKTTLADYAATWLERMTPTWRATTAAGVANSLDHHVLPVLGRHPVAAIRRSDVEALCASLALAPSTVRTIHQHLGQVLASAVEDGLMARNPATKARLPKREPAKAQPVPFEVVERIQAELPEWFQVAVPLGVGAGLRQGEASGLTVDRLNLLRRTMRIDRQLVSRHVEVPTLGPVKTESSHRTIPLAGFLVDALADHLRRFGGSGGDLVLRSPAGVPMDSDRFGNQWRQACRRAGAPGLGYHSLRHTFASTLLSRGVSVKAVADWLGHANPTITLTTYAHLMPADAEVARAVLDAALAPPADTLRTAEGLKAV